MNNGEPVTAPMTRAQKFQWYLEKGLAEGLRQLPVSMNETAVRQLMSGLENRFEILRTSLDIVDGELRQKVHDTGSPLLVIDVAREPNVQRCMARLVDDFKAERHGRVGRFLVQFYLLRDEKRNWLAVVADNAAMDAGFHSVVDEQITLILAGGSDTHSDGLKGEQGIQPAAMARRENGPHGEAERSAAREYLRHHFVVAPPQMHCTRPSDGRNEGRFYRSTLTLKGADDAFARLMSSAELLPSALILAAFSQLMCWRGDVDACSINVSLDNRHNAELRHVRCATAQRSPVKLLMGSGGLLAAAEEAQQTLSQGHPAYGRYDPFDLIREKVEAQHRRGVCLGTDLAFNFIPPPQGWTELIQAGEREVADDSSHRVAADVSWETTNEISYEYGVSLSVRWSDPQTARLSVHGDSDVMAPEQCVALLRGIELVLERAAANQDCYVEQIASEVGLRRLSRSPHEKRVHGGWADLKAIGDRLRGIGDVEEVELISGFDGVVDVARLTARVTVAHGAATVPLDLREELLTAVETGEILVAPDRYEIVCGDSADGGACSRAERSGDGRTVAGRPASTDEESALQSALEDSRLVQELDLDLCYVRAGGRLDRYPEFAEQIRRRGYVLPDFSLVSGMSTVRGLARRLLPLSAVDK
ncbi:hypothetical protein ACIRQP_38725 [Streptomyces sp. NPDC102274]|uniref:hypothetical protein n=1 Tax=Streptomyces sp. NPDC102274 TaxID=3366151 RepID=UPI00382AF596